jgi:hypothetical protein
VGVSGEGAVSVAGVNVGVGGVLLGTIPTPACPQAVIKKETAANQTNINRRIEDIPSTKLIASERLYLPSPCHNLNVSCP